MSQIKDISDYFPTRSSVSTSSQPSKLRSTKHSTSTKKATPSKRSLAVSPSSSDSGVGISPAKRTRSETKKAVDKKIPSTKQAKSTVKKNNKVSYGRTKANPTELFESLAQTCELEKTRTVENDKPKEVLNAEQVREKLKNCKNLSQLRANLSKINGCAEKLQQFKEIKVQLSPVKPSLLMSPQKFRTPEKLSVSGLSIIPVPLQASPHKPSPLKKSNLINPSTLPRLSCNRRLFADEASSSKDTPIKKDLTPAHQRYANLLKKNDAQVGLPLPSKYRDLVTMFDRMDFLVDRFQKRHERCTMDKLTRSIETTTLKKFDLEVLKKILSVGEAGQWFRLAYEVVDGSCKLAIESSDKRRDTLDAVTLHTTRVTEFHDCLLDIVKEKHLQFLVDMNLTISDADKIYRWHPMFEIQNIPDVAIKDDLLPKNIKMPSARHNSILNYFPKKNESDFEKKQDLLVKDDKSSTEPAKKIEKGVLKGVSMDLLNKIRAKEAAAKQRLMYQDPEVNKEITLLQNMAEVIRIIHSVFLISSTTKTIPLDTLCEKICDSFHCSLSVRQADTHVDYLLNAPFCKHWIQAIELNNKKYIKINIDHQLKELFLAINNRITSLTAGKLSS